MIPEIIPNAAQLREIQLTELEMLKELDGICRRNDIPYVIIAGTMLGAERHKGFIPWDDDVDVAMLRDDYVRFRKACEKDLDRERFEFQDADNTPGYRWGYGKLRRKDTLFLRRFQEDMPYFQGIFIDVFPMDPCPQGRTARALWNFRCFLVRKRLWARIGKIAEKSAVKRAVFRHMDRLPEEKALSGLDKLIKKSERYSGSDWVRILMFPTPNRQYGYLKKWYSQRADQIFEGCVFPGPADAEGYLSFKFGNYMTLPPEKERKTHPVSALRLLSERMPHEGELFLDELRKNGICVFGTGYVAGVLGLALRNYGRLGNVTAFVETVPSKKEYLGHPVISLEEYSRRPDAKDGRLYLAVHDSISEEISVELSEKGLEHRIIYPYLFDLLYGATVRTEDVPLSEIFRAQDKKHMWIAVRSAALESCDTGDTYGTEAYLKCMGLFSGPRTAEKRLERFRTLYGEIRDNGYDASKPVFLDEDMRVIDGLHRIAILEKLGADSIPCKIYRRSPLYDKVLGERNFITEKALSEAGLSIQAHEKVKKIHDRLIHSFAE